MGKFTIYSWNVNGVRAAAQKGLIDWLLKESPDILCLQETKAKPSDLDMFLTRPKGYDSVCHSAEKAGYSGVMTYFKTEPKKIHEGIGKKSIDSEGRVLATEYEDFVVINSYFPNSQREHERLPYKLEFCKEMLKYCNEWRKKKKAVLLCGDYNIAHREIDLKNPKTNKDNAGFLPQERAWMDEFLNAGFVDIFRKQNPELIDQYTWWSYRPGIRERNIGWRIDYICVNKEAEHLIQKADIHPDVYGSDHCPVSVVLKT